VIGILSDGFKISPPTSTYTGSAFGNGVYMADQLSKAISYSRHGTSVNVIHKGSKATRQNR